MTVPTLFMSGTLSFWIQDASPVVVSGKALSNVESSSGALPMGQFPLQWVINSVISNSMISL